MNKGNRLQQLEDACRDIIKINMWYELPDHVFFFQYLTPSMGRVMNLQ